MTPVILEYYLGNETEVESVDFHPLTAEASDSLRYYYTVPFAGSMYFYNYDTGNYDPIKPDKEHFDQGRIRRIFISEIPLLSAIYMTQQESTPEHHASGTYCHRKATSS